MTVRPSLRSSIAAARINLFVAQVAGSEGHRAKLETMRWSAQGLEFFAISDINAEELQEFVDKFEAALNSTGAT